MNNDVAKIIMSYDVSLSCHQESSRGKGKRERGEWERAGQIEIIKSPRAGRCGLYLCKELTRMVPV